MVAEQTCTTVSVNPRSVHPQTNGTGPSGGSGHPRSRATSCRRGRTGGPSARAPGGREAASRDLRRRDPSGPGRIVQRRRPLPVGHLQAQVKAAGLPREIEPTPPLSAVQVGEDASSSLSPRLSEVDHQPDDDARRVAPGSLDRHQVRRRSSEDDREVREPGPGPPGRAFPHGTRALAYDSRPRAAERRDDNSSSTATGHGSGSRAIEARRLTGSPSTWTARTFAGSSPAR